MQRGAASGGFTAGMSATGYLRKYINTELETLSLTDTTKEMLTSLEDAIKIYKSIPDSNQRDAHSFEVVDTGTLFINCMLLERALTRVSDTYKANLQRLHRDYQIDAMARIKGHMYRLQAAAASVA